MLSKNRGSANRTVLEDVTKWGKIGHTPNSKCGKIPRSLRVTIRQRDFLGESGLLAAPHSYKAITLADISKIEYPYSR